MTAVLNAYVDAFRGLPRPVWYLSLVLFTNRAGTMVLTFLTLYLTQELGYDLTFAGQVMSVYGLGHIAGAWLGGWLCDRLGMIRVQTLSLAFSGLGFLALEHAQSPVPILVLIFLTATAAESFRPANGAALAAFSPPALRTRAVALNRLALNLGFSIGPAVGGWLATRSYPWLFRADGLTCLAAALLLAALFAELKPHVEDGEEEPAIRDRHPLRDRAYLAFLGLTVAFAFLFFQGWTAYPVYLYEVYGLSEAHFGLLMTTNAVLILLFEMVLTHRAERFPPLSVVGFGVFLLGLGFAVLPAGSGMVFALLSVAIWTGGEMLSIPAAGGWVANRAGVKHRGMYMGLYTGAWGVAFVVAPAAGTWVYQTAGPNVLWTGVGVLSALVWLGCELLRRGVVPPLAAGAAPVPPEAA